MVDEVVGQGLIDNIEECVVLNLLILLKLSQKANVVVLSRIENIVAAFEKLFQMNLKLISQKGSQERAMNIIRAVIRCCYVLNYSPEMQENPSPRFMDFLRSSVLQNAEAKSIYDKIASSSALKMEH